ncbi:hypothetical protein PCANB_002618 [Pneumocystis canis]|nr:hypothetical protein PCANB_002618 [Pneumocystis canis]
MSIAAGASAVVPEGQIKPLDDILTGIRAYTYQMRRCLDANRLMDGLKHASTILSELRSDHLGPKQYYELYMAVFDAMRYLSTYLLEAHQSGRHHLTDVYELVQYAGNIVPRLYLMITVGTVYMGVKDAPVKEIMKDMMEMARGVQHPIRGLFLRHYLSGQTRDHLPNGTSSGPEGNLNDSITFILTNFIEMNKLWVRFQHQGHSRERERREEERSELKILVGTNLVRLSQLEGIDLNMYKTNILPLIIEQIVQCRDILAQEYLMEVIIQVFTDDFHLQTLDQFSSVTSKLNPCVNIKQIWIHLIDRLAAYALRESEVESFDERVKKEKLALEALGEQFLSMNLNKDTFDIAEDNFFGNSDIHKEQDRNVTDDIKTEINDNVYAIPSDSKLFTLFWVQIVKLIKARPDLPIQDISALLVSLCKLALTCCPYEFSYVDLILKYARLKITECIDSVDLHSVESRENFLKLLLEPVTSYSYILTVFSLRNYIPLLQTQSYSIRRAVAASVIQSLIKNNIRIETPEILEGVICLVRVLIIEGMKSSFVGNVQQNRRNKDNETDETLEEQGWLARLIHLVYNENADIQFKLLQILKKSFFEGGERIKYTGPSLITQAIKLARKYKSRECLDNDWIQKASAVYKFIHQIVNYLYSKVTNAELCIRYFVIAGQVADQGAFEEIAYDFFAQAFTIYEESLSDSRAQYQAVIMIAGVLQTTRNFSPENYDTLITKCALHGSKLLKKPDQTRAVYFASHLWWVTNIPARGEQNNNKFYHDGSRSLECLQKALKLADACIDTLTSTELFIEILNRYIYYYDHQNESILPKYLNGLIDLIRQNIDNFDTQTIEPNIRQFPIAISTSSILEPEGNQSGLNDYGLISKGNDDRLKDFRVQEELYEKLEKKANRDDETLEEAFSLLKVGDSNPSPVYHQHCQLREGIRASQRIDAFACNVYETSARVGIYMNHVESYLPALQYLVDVLYPALLRPFSDNQLVTCYLLYLVCGIGDLHELYKMKRRLQINSQDLSFQIARIIIQNNYIAWWKLRGQAPWLYQRMIDQGRVLMQERCTRVISAAYYCISRQWIEPYIGSTLTATHWIVDGDKMIVRVRK